METRRLVFVIGAGASKAFGDIMPIGSQLAERIERQLSQEFAGDTSAAKGPIASALSVPPGGMTTKLFEAARAVRSGLIHQASIDNLLHEWSQDSPEMVLVGKLAIAYLIFKAEEGSALGSFKGNELEKAFSAIGQLRNSWPGYLMQNLKRETTRRRDVADVFSDIGFVVFNYDRCLEQYLFWAFRSAGLSKDAAVEALSGIPVLHAYGTLGQLPFMAGAEEHVPFGASSTYLKKAAEGIKTYTEENHDPDHVARIRHMVHHAGRLVFLGFGYHPKNLDLLLGQETLKGCDVWGASEHPNMARLNAAARMLCDESVAPLARLTTYPCKDFLEVHADFLA